MATNGSLFKQATRTKGRARVALIGPSGSGKTFTALRIAQGFGGRIAVLDTERGSASKYACPPDREPQEGEFRFAVVDDMPNFSPENYMRIIKAAGEEGFDVLIIDSLSHAWSGEGGALEMVDNAKSRHQGSGFNAWSEVTPLQERLVQAMLKSPCHIIATMRAKTEYQVDKDERGKTRILKLGLAPVQRDTMEYEFDVTATLDQDHKFVVTKSRCHPLNAAVIPCAGEEVGTTLKRWLDNGAPMPEPAAPQFAQAQVPETPPPPSPPMRDEITERIIKLQEQIAVRWAEAQIFHVGIDDIKAATAALRSEVSGGRAQKLRDLSEPEADELAAELAQWAEGQTAPATDPAMDPAPKQEDQ